MTRSRLLAGFLGNFLEHYDQTLFTLVAPCLASLFFSELPYLPSLIATFAIACLGVFTYPLGSLFFGRIGDRRGRETALFFTMMGMAAATVAIGCLPTSHRAGGYAWLLLACLRCLQDFFIAGESKGSAIFLLEQTRQSARGFMSGLADASSMFGILAASGLVTLFSAYGILEQNWRWLFWLGGLTALAAMALRSLRSGAPSIDEGKSQESLYAVLWRERRPLIAIVLASGFSYTTYIFPFAFMTSFAPLISDLKSAEMLKLNTLLLVADMLLLPLFGLLTKKIAGYKMMGLAALALSLLAFPLFSLLYQPSELNVVIVRVTIVILGVAFAAPFHMWALSIVPQERRYTVISFGYAIGSKLIGIPSLAISFWLYHKTESLLAPATYLCFASLLAAGAIWKTSVTPAISESR